MTRPADVCLLLEGTYPYVMGGVSSWTHALIGAAPHLTFHVVTLLPDREPREVKYKAPPNLVGLTHVFLDSGHPGRMSLGRHRGAIDAFGQHMQRVFTDASLTDFIAALDLVDKTRCGQRALLDSRAGWRAMEQAYASLLPTAPMVEFFWTWRALMRSMISIMAAPLPEASVYHAISTGYAGVFGARAHHRTGKPLVITEHGIYTNERRIEIGMAEWLYDSERNGFSVNDLSPELRDIWQQAFSCFARLAYDAAESITTLYTGNQNFQRADGAADAKLRVIPNGVDYKRFAAVERSNVPRRPTIALIGRVVPIKDLRTFIFACAALRRRVPDLEALILGPEDEDAAYSAECRALVEQQGLQECVKFEGRVDIASYLGRIDVIALTSISEAQPLVLLEAGAAGIPSVATDVGSCRELLEGFALDPVQGKGGFVTPVGDIEAIADGLGQILLDPDLRARMGGIMRRRVETYYNKLVVDRVYNELYESLLNRSSPALRSGGAAWRG